MKNSVISVLLFIVLVFSLLFLNNEFVSLCDDIIMKCEEIEVLLDDKNELLAYETSVKLLEFIKERDSIPAIYLNHADYDFLMNESLKLSLYIEGDDKAESLATLHVLRYNAEHLKNLQKPDIKNLF